MNNKQILLNDVAVEVLHAGVQQSFPAKDGRLIQFTKNVCLIPLLGNEVYEVGSKEPMQKGKQKVTLAISGKKDETLKISVRVPETAQASEKGGKVA